MRRPRLAVEACAVCNSTRNVQKNHVGGRRHLAWFTMPFCGHCHDLFHAMADRAGIDLTFTHDPIERIRRALAAITIAEWMLLQQLKIFYSNQRSNMMKATKRMIVLPPPTASAKNQLAPFLKAKDIAEKGITKLTLLGPTRQSNSQFGEGIDVACKIGEAEYTWTITFESVNYRILFERFNSNVANWNGVVEVERKAYLGNQYVAVVG